MDLSKSSIKKLHDLVTGMTPEQYQKKLQELNDVAFDRHNSSIKRRKSHPKSNTEATDADNQNSKKEKEYELIEAQMEANIKIEDDCAEDYQERSRQGSFDYSGNRRNMSNGMITDERNEDNYQFDGEIVYINNLERSNYFNDRDYNRYFEAAFNFSSAFDSNDAPINRVSLEVNSRLSSRKVSREEDYIFNFIKP